MVTMAPIVYERISIGSWNACSTLRRLVKAKLQHALGEVVENLLQSLIYTNQLEEGTQGKHEHAQINHINDWIAIHAFKF